jgi:hypothetical protein
VNALTFHQQRRRSLMLAREDMRSVFRTGGMSDSELLDLVNFVAAQCSPEQHESKERLLTIAQDLDLDEPDADAFRFIAPATLDTRLEKV